MKEIKLKGLDEIVYYDECDNGLKVYLWVNKKVNTFYGTLSVKYGSVYKDFKINNKVYKTPYGIAHFLEHIKFNESEDTTAQDYFKKTGCDTNAFTTFLYTNYQVFGTNDCKNNVIHLLDFVQNPYFTKTIVKNEKNIIIEEANSTTDNAYNMLFYNLIDNMFNKTHYKRIITGTKDDVKSINYDDIKLVYNTFYHPKNMFLIVTGNFNPFEIMESIKENQNKKEFNKYLYPERIIEKESKKVVEKYEEKNENVSNKKIKVGYKIPRKLFKDYDEMHIRIYLNILLNANFGQTSEFREDLISKELISNMGYSFNRIDDYYLISFIFESEYKEEILKQLDKKINEIDIDEKTFNRKKKGYIASLILDYEDVEYVNDMLQYEIMTYGDIIKNSKEIMENLKYEDIIKFKDLIDFKEKSILIYNPKNK